MYSRIKKLIGLVMTGLVCTALAETELPRVDHTITVGPFTIQANELGDFMAHAEIGVGLTAGKTYHIVGSQVEARDSSNNVHPGLHHLITQKIPKNPGPNSPKSLGFIMADNYGYYIPGNGLRVYPAGMGKKIKGDDTIKFSIHMNIAHAPPDVDKKFTINLKLMLAENIDQIIYELLATDIKSVGLVIPAGDPYAVYSFNFDPFQWIQTKNQQLTLVATAYHMHQWGIEGWLEKVAKNGQSTFVHKAPNYSFANQANYYLATPQIISKGMKLRSYCAWDNSEDNQPYVDGEQLEPADIHWGESSFEEMCFNFLSFTEPNPSKSNSKK